MEKNKLNCDPEEEEGTFTTFGVHFKFQVSCIAPYKECYPNYLYFGQCKKSVATTELTVEYLWQLNSCLIDPRVSAEPTFPLNGGIFEFLCLWRSVEKWTTVTVYVLFLVEILDLKI